MSFSIIPRSSVSSRQIHESSPTHFNVLRKTRNETRKPRRLEDLPDEILLQIFTETPQIWATACLAIPFIGRWTFSASTMAFVKRRFVSAIEFPDRRIWLLNKRMFKVEYLSTNTFREVIDGVLREPVDRNIAPRRIDEEPNPVNENTDGNDKYLIRTFEDGTVVHFLNGLIHRDYDLPAMICPDGTMKWIRFARLHRSNSNDDPALITPNRKEWWVNGKRHRDNGLPAICEWLYDSEPIRMEWFVRDKRHRDDGKHAYFVTTATETKMEWWVDDQLHNTDGQPAVVIINPITGRTIRKEYWVLGKQHRTNGPAVEVFSNDMAIEEDTIQEYQYWRFGVLHRDPDEQGNELPAKENKLHRIIEYWRDGLRHRINGPAIIEGVGDDHEGHMWYYKGELHRDDGPAAIYKDGSTSWYCHGMIF